MTNDRATIRRPRNGTGAPRERKSGARRRGRWLESALVAAAVFLPQADALALWDDKLELFIRQTVTYDSNVFRISERADSLAVIGSTSKGDTYYTTSPGFNFNIPYSRQRFLAGYRWDYTRYNNFNVLDFDGHEGRAAWQWQAGNDWFGQIGYSESLHLQSLANSPAGILTGEPNSLDTKRTFLNANYLVTPRWRLQGDLGRTEQENGLAALTVNNIIIENGGLALMYITPLKNQVGAGVRVEDGRYPNREGLPQDAVSDNYQQTNIDALLDYNITGHSRLIARVGWTDRRNDQLSQRDIDEGTYNVTYEWRATGKTTMNAIARREVAPLDDTVSRFVLLTGYAFRPIWRVTEKITTTFNFEYSSRDYISDPSLLIVPERTDWVRTASARVAWRPTRAITLDTSLFYETRSSTFPLGDYEVFGGSLGIRFGF